MSESEPKPAQPNALPFWKWMLLLMPSLMVLAAPVAGDFGANALNKPGELEPTIEIALLTIGLAAVLCFVLGFFFEKWCCADSRNWWRLLGWAILILIVNGTIAFGGCFLIYN
jgi:hypothetical protein